MSAILCNPRVDLTNVQAIKHVQNIIQLYWNEKYPDHALLQSTEEFISAF